MPLSKWIVIVTLPIGKLLHSYIGDVKHLTFVLSMIMLKENIDHLLSSCIDYLQLFAMFFQWKIVIVFSSLHQ